MDTTRTEDSVDPTEMADGASGTAQRAREVVADVAGTARSAVEAHTPTVREAAGAARSIVQAHGPTVLEVGRSTATSAYGQVRQAPDERLAQGAAFAAGLLTGFVVARVPRPLLLLALTPLLVLGGTLLGRRIPLIGRALRPTGRTGASDQPPSGSGSDLSR